MNKPCDFAAEVGPRPAAVRRTSVLLRRTVCLLVRLSVLLLAVPVLMAHAQVSATGVVTPAAPTYVDPVTLQVTVTAGSSPVGNVTYSVDGGTSSSAAVANGVATLSLGRYGVGSHAVTFQFQGTPSSTAPQTANFAVADLPFALLWSKLTVIDNHGGWADGAPDVNNNMLITNTAEGKLYRLDPQNRLSVVPTTGIASPVGIATDAAGNAFVADSTNNAVVELSASGQQTTLSIAGLLTPTYVALDAAAANLYITDSGHSRIVRYTLQTGALTVVVPQFDRLGGLTTDAAGLLYFMQYSSYGPGGVFRVEANGAVTGPYFGVTSPQKLHSDGQGNLYVVDGYDGLERFDGFGHRTWIDAIYSAPIGIDRLGVPFSFGVYGYAYPPGPVGQLDTAPALGPNSTDFLVYSVPSGSSVVSLDTTNANGNLIAQQGGIGCGAFACTVGEVFGPTVPGLHSGTVTAKLNTGATLTTTFFGVGLNSNEAFDPGVQTSAPTQLMSAGGIAEFEDGTLFVSDTARNQVYSIPAGGGAPVSLNLTGLSAPTQVAVDGAKTVYVLDSGNSRIVSITAAGQQSTVYNAGEGALLSITALASDGSGALFVGGTYGSTGPGLVELDATRRLRLIERTGTVPTAITLDGLGDVWWVDGSGVLRRVVDHGFSAAVTSTDVASGLGTVQAISADPSGTVFVARGSAGTVVGVRPDGSTFPVYSGLGNASAVVVNGRSVLHAVDSGSNTLLTDDRRTTAFAFGNQAVGGTSGPIQRTLSNDGNQVLAGIGGLPGDSTFPMDGSAAQACTSAVPNAGTQLALGSYCTLTYRFTPPYANTFNETGDEQDSTPAPGIEYTLRPLTFTGTGVQGTTATLTPATVSFGSVTTGTTATAQVLTLQNTGTATLNIASVTASGSGFSISANSCAATLAANSSCTISVVFAPSATGPASGTVTVTDDATNGTTQTAALSGTGAAAAQPTATLTPGTYDFGTIPLSYVQTDFVQFVLTNTGTVPVTVTSFGLLGANASSFTQFQEHTCFVGATLAPGASCPLYVAFQPQATGPATATLTVVDSAGTQTAVLTGNATSAAAPGATLTPATQDFGSVTVGATSTAQTFTLSNTGNTPLNVQTIAIGGADAAGFAVTGGSCSAAQQQAARPVAAARRGLRSALAVAAGGTCTVTVVFTPAHSGASTATLSVVDDAGTQTSALTGTGNAAVVTAPQAALTPGTGGFGTVTVGGSGAVQTFTLLNAGNAALAITSAVISGANSSNFVLQGNTCGASLAAGASCTLLVGFTPTSAGAETATLSVVDSVGTQTAVLSGTGSAPVTTAADFTLGATPGSQTGARGAAIAYTVQLQSVSAANPFTGPVALTVSGLPAGATATFAPATVVPGTTQPAVSQMTVTVPVLAARFEPAHTSGASGISAARLACLLAPFGLAAACMRRRLPARLLALLCLFGIGMAMSGCGSGTGFGLPLSTSTLTITGTSGPVTHTTTVSLTVR